MKSNEMEENKTPESEEKKLEEQLEDLTPDKDAIGGGPHVRVLDGRGLHGAGASLDAQKKEISGE